MLSDVDFLFTWVSIQRFLQDVYDFHGMTGKFYWVGNSITLIPPLNAEEQTEWMKEINPAIAETKHPIS